MDNFQINELLSLFLANDGFIVVHKSIIKLFGNSAANFLAELISEYNYYKKEDRLLEKDGKEWFFSTIKNIEENIGFTREQQDRLIKSLVNFKDINNNVVSIIEHCQMGVPSKRYFSINFDVICELLKQSPELIGKGYKNRKKIDINSKIVQNSAKNVDFSRSAKKELQEVPKSVDFSSMCKTHNLECVNDTNKKVQNTQPRMSKTHNLECVNNTTNNNNTTLINNLNNNNSILSSDIYGLNNKKERREEDYFGFANEKVIKDEFNINIEYIKLKYQYENELSAKESVFNVVYEQIISIIDSVKEYFMISGEKINKSEYIDRILELNSDDIKNIVDRLFNNQNEVKNLRNYLLATIYYEAVNKKLLVLNNKGVSMSRDDYNKWFENKFLKNVN